ncbi:MAG: beta-ketoacyl-[acyl-carrier-protein] synthase family protein [Sedimentisphaerales bacterium]|nr:beta-ketoacyl-[acyl-carrier-protein] synthase family protein [Sedimentisphaerales bacterium]
MISTDDQIDIYISGVGVISAAGSDLSSALISMENGQRCASDAGWLKSPLKGPFFDVPDINVPTGKMRTLCLLEKALKQALEMAALPDMTKLRVGIAMGTTVACQLNDLPFYSDYREQRHNDLSSVDTFLKGNLAEAVALMLGTHGPHVTVVNACSSGADAIGIAADWLKAGYCDVAIAGGADELNRVSVSGFHALGVSSDKLCAPFDRDREGLNLGEGAGVLILESRKRLHGRKDKPWLRLCGYGASNDAYHLTRPLPEGTSLKRSIQTAFDQAGVTFNDIAFVNAHGTATRENDKVEGQVLLEYLPGVPVVSSKAYTGHTLGAAGAIEAVYSGAALLSGWIPATTGYKNKDEEILLVPTQEKTTVSKAYALSTSIAFGGNNAALVLKREGD